MLYSLENLLKNGLTYQTYKQISCANMKKSWLGFRNRYLL